MEPRFFLTFVGTTAALAGVTLLSKKVVAPFILDRQLLEEDFTYVRLNHLPRPLSPSSEFRLESLRFEDEVRNTVGEFYSTLSPLEHVNLNNFYNNIGGLQINISESDDIYRFNPDDMVLTVSPDNLRVNLLYGLSYLASRNSTDHQYACGFVRESEDGMLGSGLSKGFIDSLLIRRFGIGDKPVNSDARLYITSVIEFLVGADNMESSFFRSATEEIIANLTHYTTFKEAVIIVRELDHLDIALKQNSIVSSALSRKVYRDLAIRLSRMLVKKLKKESVEGISAPAAQTVDILVKFIEGWCYGNPIPYNLKEDDKSIVYQEMFEGLDENGIEVKFNPKSL